MGKQVKEVSSEEVVCLFGFPLGHELNFPGKTVIVFRPTHFFSSPYEVHLDQGLCDWGKFQGLCREHVFKVFSYLIYPELEDKKKKEILPIMEKCKELEWQVQLSASDYQDFGVQVFKNLCESASLPLDETFFLHAKGFFQNKPALICGAGPSLQNELSILKALEDQALVFAGGASLGYLTGHGVPVHIAAGIDPNPEMSRVLIKGGNKVPFFMQSRFSSSCLKQIKGPLFCVPSNEGYPLEAWLQEGEVFDGGWTVSTFLVALAAYFGCNPIILVGVDLSYKEAVYVQEEKGAQGGEILPCGLITKKDWLLAARWLEAFVREKSEYSFYNTSFSGLALEGIQRERLSVLLTKKLSKNQDLIASIEALISSWSHSEKRKEKILLLVKSLEASLGFVNQMLDLFSLHYPEDPSNKGVFILASLDLQAELFYQKVLEPLWQIWQFPMQRAFVEAYAQDLNQLLFFKRVLQEYKQEII